MQSHSEVIVCQERISLCALLSLNDIILLNVVPLFAGVCFIISIRFFVGNGKPQTAKCHVTTALRSRLQFAVHV